VVELRLSSRCRGSPATAAARRPSPAPVPVMSPGSAWTTASPATAATT